MVHVIVMDVTGHKLARSSWSTKKTDGLWFDLFFYFSQKILVWVGLKRDNSGWVNKFLPVLPCLRVENQL